MKRIWPLLNSPLFVLLIAFALWPWVSGWARRFETQSTLKEMSDPAKQVGIKTAVSSLVSQLFEGVTSGFNSLNTRESAKLSNFNAVLGQVSVSDIKMVPSQFGNREKIIGSVHNGSGGPISGLRINVMMFGADGSLIDVEDKTLHDIKLLQPGQTVGFSAEHDLGTLNQDKTVLEARKAAKVTVQVVGFEIPQPGSKVSAT
jgi:hypothetical protein